MTARPPLIMVIGSINMDLIYRVRYHPLPGETQTSTMSMLSPGGKGANQAVACARAGRHVAGPAMDAASGAPLLPGSVSMIGAVGDDDVFADSVLDNLVSAGVDVSGIRHVPGMKTGTAVVIVEEDTGENRIILAPGANHTLTPESFPKDFFDILPADKRPDLLVLQLEIPRETVVRIIHLAHAASIPVLMNPAPAQKLPDDALNGLEHLIVNRTETAILLGIDAEQDVAEPAHYEKCCAALAARGVRNVVITLGSAGAAWRSNGVYGFVPAVQGVPVVDTTGAGDTFIGTYVRAVLAGGADASVEKAVRFAVHAGAQAVQVKGAQGSIPWIDALDLGLLK